MARLATDATVGLTDVVEAMHERIARLPGLPASGAQGRTRGLTGLVYGSVRGITRLVGGGVDALLGLLPPGAPGAVPGPEREALVAALNGVLGDHLAATANPLATTMSLRRGGVALDPDGRDWDAALADATAEVLVLVHGLCMNDLQWTRNGHDHGRELARSLGLTPLYLLYNSGLPVGRNGQALSALLERMVRRWPQPVRRLVLLGHSMGGLVARSAVHAGVQAGHRWPSRLQDLVFLGTPHHGAPLERAGHGLQAVLAAVPYAAPLARLARVRSAGITDLRHGNLLEDDGGGADRFASGRDHRRPLPLPAGVRCFALASTVGSTGSDLKGRLLGDGLVPLASALGRHRDPARRLAFAESRQWVGHGIGHLDLLSDPAVYAQLQRWLGDGGAR